MKVVILCGGQGTRIRGVDDNLPKPMIPIGQFPILWHIMKYYAESGYKEFVLCLGYKGQVIKEFFLNYETYTSDFTLTLGTAKGMEFHNTHNEINWKITLAETGLNAMTGARVRKIQKYLQGEENFMLTYGDGVGNVNIAELLAFHRSHGKVMTITGVRPPGRFGELMSNSEGKVTEFNEKPQASGGRISGGFFVCRKEIFNYLEEREDLILEQEPMRRLVCEGQMMVYEHDSFWQPMDTYRDYMLLNELYQKGKAPWVIW
ncbi:MAG: glucose-1-phosphate cytidylyltransferase [Thermodesulfovibrionales bacterium]|jgi:glucose-1-phosphate cytidylyltransferase|nr:glucose-1-phosphate cytidylyltransferase [Thermodesulfovibrionales bacterium]